ncbi:hypothetical protein B0H19DRAFT_1084399 [Mycena capillaripes]|nr:hypothetical protein B0H19DRAFT_1084399 [Mycena capillaripes]
MSTTSIGLTLLTWGAPKTISIADSIRVPSQMLEVQALPERNKKLPENIQLDLAKVEVQCGLPVWHASSHKAECNNDNSLSFLRKLLVAIAERKHQVKAFKVVNKSVLKESHAVWQAQIDAFVSDHMQPNPYTAALMV